MPRDPRGGNLGNIAPPSGIIPQLLVDDGTVDQVDYFTEITDGGSIQAALADDFDQNNLQPPLDAAPAVPSDVVGIDPGPTTNDPVVEDVELDEDFAGEPASDISASILQMDLPQPEDQITVQMTISTASPAADVREEAQTERKSAAQYTGRLRSSDLTFNRGFSRAEQELHQKALDAYKPSLGEAFGLAYQNTSYGLLFGTRDSPTNGAGFRPDPAFRLTAKLLEELTPSIPLEYADIFNSAVSYEHAKYLRERILEELEDKNKLASLGALGIGIQATASATDLPVLLLGSATGEAAIAGFALRGAAAASASVLAGGAVSVVLTPPKLTDSRTDILANFAAAGVGRIIQAPVGKVAASALGGRQLPLLDSAATTLFSSAAVGLARNGTSAYTPPRPYGEPLLNGRSVSQSPTYDPMASSLEKQFDDAAGLSAIQPSKPYNALDQLQTSNNPTVRALSGQLQQNLGLEGEDDADQTILDAIDHQQALRFRNEAKFYRDLQKPFEEWANKKELNWLGRQEQRGLFMAEVAKAIRDQGADVSEEAKMAAKMINKMFEDVTALARNPGLMDGSIVPPIKGFDNLSDNASIPRFLDQHRTAQLIEEFGFSTMQDFLTQSLMAANPGLEADFAMRYSDWLLKKLRSADTGMSLQSMRALAGDDPGSLREMLLRDDPYVTEDDIDAISANMARKGGGGDYSENNSYLNPNFTARLPTRDGLELKDVQIADLFADDIEQIFMRYNSQVLGAMSLARAGFSSFQDYEQMLRDIRATAALDPDYTQDDMDRDLTNLELIGTMIGGVPVGSLARSSFDGRVAGPGQLMRLVRDYDFARRMNKPGFAEMIEMGNLLGDLTIQTMQEYMPAFKSVIRDARKGKLDPELLLEVEAAWGSGADILCGLQTSRGDEISNPVGLDRLADPIPPDQLQPDNKRAASALTGTKQINAAFQRWVAKVIAHKIIRSGNDSAQASVKDRLFSTGLSEMQWKNIVAQIQRKPAKVMGLLTNEEIPQISLESWDDAPEGVEARIDLEMAAFRLSRRIVHDDDQGNARRWLSPQFARLMREIKALMSISWARQVLSRRYGRDRETFASWVNNIVPSAVSYIVQAAARVQSGARNGGDAQDPYSSAAIGRAAFQRAGWLNMMPMGGSDAAAKLLADPMVDYRYNGLLQQGLVGESPFDKFSRSPTEIHAVPYVLGDQNYIFSTDDYRNVTRLTPMQNALSIRGIQQLLLSEEVQ